MEVIVTKHAVERFNQRFRGNHDHWGLLNIINHSEESRSIYNDLTFMMSIYERYGYDTKYKFFVKDSAVFVGIVEDDKVFIVTTISNKSGKYGRTVQQPKFKGKGSAKESNEGWRKVSKIFMNN